MYDFIAKDALNDLTENGADIKEDRLNDAEEYAEAAYLHMGYLSSYNPFEDAPSLSRVAATEYVKAKIMGRDPSTVGSFMVALQLWQRSAAIAVHKDRKIKMPNHLYRTLDRSDESRRF